MTDAGRDEPTAADVSAAIDALAEKAKRSIFGGSGHAWGTWAEIDRQAALLKRALSARTTSEEETHDSLRQLRETAGH